MPITHTEINVNKFERHIPINGITKLAIKVIWQIRGIVWEQIGRGTIWTLFIQLKQIQASIISMTKTLHTTHNRKKTWKWKIRGIRLLTDIERQYVDIICTTKTKNVLYTCEDSRIIINEHYVMLASIPCDVLALSP